MPQFESRIACTILNFSLNWPNISSIDHSKASPAKTIPVKLVSASQWLLKLPFKCFHNISLFRIHNGAINAFFLAALWGRLHFSVVTIFQSNPIPIFNLFDSSGESWLLGSVLRKNYKFVTKKIEIFTSASEISIVSGILKRNCLKIRQANNR